MCTVHWPCLLCSDTRRRSHVLKDNDWHDVTRTFGMGELRGSECSCFPPSQGWVVVDFNRSAWFGDSLKAYPQTPWPNAGKAGACVFPLHSLLLGCEIVVRSFHTVSAQKFSTDQKEKECHASISKLRPISSYSLHRRDYWDIDSLPQTRLRPDVPQSISLKLGT